MKIGIFLVISLSVNFEALVQKATIYEITRQIIWPHFWIFILIGLRGLRGINSKNGVSSIVSVMFYYGIIIGMIRETVWTYKWVDPLIGLRGLTLEMVFLL